MAAEETPTTSQETPSRGISDKLVGLTAAYVNHRRARATLGEPRYAGNGQVADYTCLLITHPEAVQEWMDDPAYSHDRITLLLQWYVQISQVYGPAMVYDIMDRRHDNLWHEFDHRVALQSSGGTPVIGTIIYAGPMESTSGTQAQSDYVQGDPIFELVHYPRSWEQLPIGTTLTQIMHHYPNHMKDEHVDAFEQQGVSGKTMSTGQPKVLRDLLISISVRGSDKPENANNKRLQYRKNDIVTRYGAAGWNSLINSPVKLRATGPAVSFRQTKSVDHRFIPNPEDRIVYQNKTFSGPPTRRAVVEGYKRDKTADAQKKAARATKNFFNKSRNLVADFLPRWEPLRTRVNVNSVFHSRLTRAFDANDGQNVRRPTRSSRRQVKTKRHHDETDIDEEDPIRGHVSSPPPKRRRADHKTFYPVGQSSRREQHNDHPQPAYMPAQARHDGLAYPGIQPSTGPPSQSYPKLIIDSNGNARLQRRSDNSNPPLQPQPTNSSQPSLAGQKRNRDDAEEYNEIMTGELTQPASKKAKQTTAASGIDVSSSDSQSTLIQAGKVVQQEEETLDNPGAHGWFDVGRDGRAVDCNQPQSHTDILSRVDWASLFNNGPVPELMEPLPLSSDNQHTNDDVGDQDSDLQPGEARDLLDFMRDEGQYRKSDAAAASGDSPRPLAQAHATATHQSQPAGSSPGPSISTKRGRDEFEEDDQTSQKPRVDRPHKKLKQTVASTPNETTEDLMDSELRAIFSAEGMEAARDSLALDGPQLEWSTRSAQDSELNYANQPTNLGLSTTDVDYPLASANSPWISNPTAGAEGPYTFEESHNSAPVAAEATTADLFNFDEDFGTVDTKDAYTIEEMDNLAPVAAEATAAEATAAGGFNIDDDLEDLFGPELMGAYDWSL